MKLESLMKIGTTWDMIEAGSTTRSDEITVMSLRTLLHSRVNSSGEPLARSWKEDELWEEETEGMWWSGISVSIWNVKGGTGGWRENPVKDLAFLPLGVGDGEWGRLEEAEEWLDIQRKKSRKGVNREERERKRKEEKKRNKREVTRQVSNVFWFS